MNVSELIPTVARVGKASAPVAGAFLSLTSKAVSRKSYRPPVWTGSIMSRIRWISAPRCWMLENKHPVRGEGALGARH